MYHSESQLHTCRQLENLSEGKCKVCFIAGAHNSWLQILSSNSMVVASMVACSCVARMQTCPASDEWGRLLVQNQHCANFVDGKSWASCHHCCHAVFVVHIGVVTDRKMAWSLGKFNHYPDLVSGMAMSLAVCTSTFNSAQPSSYPKTSACHTLGQLQQILYHEYTSF